MYIKSTHTFTVYETGFFLMLHVKGEDLQLKEASPNPPDGYSLLQAAGWPSSSVSAVL